MSNTIYFGTTNGRLIDNFDVAKAAFIVEGKRIEYSDHDAIRQYAASCKGIKKEIENPSVKYLVKRGFKFQAIKVYKQSHPEMSLGEVKEIIEKIAQKEANKQDK